MDRGEAGPRAEGNVASPAAVVGLESTSSDPQSPRIQTPGNLSKLLMPRLPQTKETTIPRAGGKHLPF